MDLYFHLNKLQVNERYEHPLDHSKKKRRYFGSKSFGLSCLIGLNRDFQTNRPNQLYVTDITYIACGQRFITFLPYKIFTTKRLSHGNCLSEMILNWS